MRLMGTDEMNEYIIINSVVFVILLLISQFIVWFAKKIGKCFSLYKVFGIVDVFWGVAILILAIIEFVMPGGDLRRIVQTMLIMKQSV